MLSAGDSSESFADLDGRRNPAERIRATNCLAPEKEVLITLSFESCQDDIFNRDGFRIHVTLSSAKMK